MKEKIRKSVGTSNNIKARIYAEGTDKEIWDDDRTYHDIIYKAGADIKIV